jgi:hypothetical protein
LYLSFISQTAALIVHDCCYSGLTAAENTRIKKTVSKDDFKVHSPIKRAFKFDQWSCPLHFIPNLSLARRSALIAVKCSFGNKKIILGTAYT